MVYNIILMSVTEKGESDMVETYKCSIMKRYQLAQANPRGGNCHDAAYYLLGVEPRERYLDGVCFVDFNIFRRADELNQAFLIAFGRVYENELFAVHLATIHPYNKTKVIHRDITGSSPPGQPSLWGWILGGCRFFGRLRDAKT